MSSDSTTTTRRRSRLRRVIVAAVIMLFAAELVLGWPSLISAFGHLRAPKPGWLAGAVAAELIAMGAYARMQRSLLRSAGVQVPIYRHLALAYAAHSLSVTLPAGPAFSTRFNYVQMRRFGATPAVATWCITLSAILSAAALALITVTGALVSHGTPQWYGLAALAATGVLITAGIRQAIHRPEGLKAPIRGALMRVNRMRRRAANQGLARVDDFIDQLGAARLRPGRGAAAAAFAVLNWVADAVCLWMCLHAVGGASIAASQVLLAFCAGMAAGTLTIIPGGLGIIDSALILGLVTGGVDLSTAIAAVVLYRLISFVFIIGIGWITWLIIRHRHRDHMTAHVGGDGA